MIQIRQHGVYHFNFDVWERANAPAKLGKDASDNITEDAADRSTGGESCECDGSRPRGRERMSQGTQLERCGEMRITLVWNNKGNTTYSSWNGGGRSHSLETSEDSQCEAI